MDECQARALFGVVIPVHVSLTTCPPIHLSQAVGRGERVPHRHVQLWVIQEVILGAPNYRQWVVGTQDPHRIASNAGVDAGVPHLGVVDHQLPDVGDDYVTVHLVGLHDDPLVTFRLLLPGDIRLRHANYVTVEADCAAGVHRLVTGVAVKRRWERVLLVSRRRREHRRVLGQWAGLRSHQVVAAGDHCQGDPADARLGIHVAAVEVGEAVRGAREAGLLLAAVLALADRLAFPDVTGGALLAADETLARGDGDLSTLSCLTGQSIWRGRGAIGETGSDTAVQATHICAAFFKV